MRINKDYTNKQIINHFLFSKCQISLRERKKIGKHHRQQNHQIYGHMKIQPKNKKITTKSTGASPI